MRRLRDSAIAVKSPGRRRGSARLTTWVLRYWPLAYLSASTMRYRLPAYLSAIS